MVRSQGEVLSNVAAVSSKDGVGVDAHIVAKLLDHRGELGVVSQVLVSTM